MSVITMKRIAGGSKTNPDPKLELFKDSQLIPDEEGKLLIVGRSDVLPAVERGIEKAKALFGVELRPDGRNRWTSEPAVKPVKQAKPKNEKVEPINKQQLKAKLQGRAVIPDSAAARSTPNQPA
jgi:hypothetical protein